LHDEGNLRIVLRRANEGADRGISMADYKLTQEQADALLQKLSTDDDFRALFQKDVGAAFQQLPGKPAAPADLTPGCCLVPKTLASKAKIAATRSALLSTLTSRVEHKVFLLEE
jgi:putative modified peptide